jgi:membrane protease subunit HflC
MPARKHAVTLIVALIAAIVLILPLCTFQVRTTEVAIVSTFGKNATTPVKAGLHFKWPWPFQKVHRLDTSLQVFETRHESAYTADEKNIVVSFYAAWRIADPIVFQEKFSSTDDARRLLGELIANEKTVVIGQRASSDLVSVRGIDAADSFAAIEAEILSRVAAAASANYGITVEALGIQHLGVPESVTDEIFERMRAQRAVKAEQIRAEGEAEAASIRLAAEKSSQLLLADARANASKIRNEGDVAEAKAYEAFMRDPEFALFLRRLKALETTMDSKTTLVIDTDVRPYDMLNPDNALKPLRDNPPQPADSDDGE